jgi:threonine aldolase
MLESGAWLRNARHANECAAKLEAKLADIPGIRFLSRRQANSVFIDLPPHVLVALRGRGWKFYTFIGDSGARFMCSWDTTDADLDAFAQDLREVFALPPDTAAVAAASHGPRPR